MIEDKIENNGLQQYFEKYKPQIENALREHSPDAPSAIEAEFAETIEDVLFPGIKRLHAVLTLLGAELFGGKAEMFLPVAAAVEYIGSSAWIFNRLAYEENVPENFKKKDIGIAVAVSLLNASYSLVFVNHNGLPERAMRAHAEIVEYVGAGLMGGKLIDQDVHPDSESTKNALMRLALRLGAILAGANYLELAQLSRFAELLGDANRISGEDAKRILVENFPSSEARTCLIQLTDHLAAWKT